MPTWANGEIFELSVASVVILLVIYPRTLIFAMFFINEINYIAEMRKEGKMYGIVA